MTYLCEKVYQATMGGRVIRLSRLRCKVKDCACIFPLRASKLINISFTPDFFVTLRLHKTRQSNA